MKKAILVVDDTRSMRALVAQATDLTKAAVAMGDTKLATRAATLQTALTDCARAGKLDKVLLDAHSREAMEHGGEALDMPSGLEDQVEAARKQGEPK